MQCRRSIHLWRFKEKRDCLFRRQSLSFTLQGLPQPFRRKDARKETTERHIRNGKRRNNATREHVNTRTGRHARRRRGWWSNGPGDPKSVSSDSCEGVPRLWPSSEKGLLCRWKKLVDKKENNIVFLTEKFFSEISTTGVLSLQLLRKLTHNLESCTTCGSMAESFGSEMTLPNVTYPDLWVGQTLYSSFLLQLQV